MLPLEDGVVELRQYTLHPGRRDELIALFEREFIETQEALGLHVIGQFRDQGRPDASSGCAVFATWPAARRRWRRSTVGRCGGPTATPPTQR